MARVVADNSAALLAKIYAIAGRELDKAALDIEANAKASIKSGSKTGRIYKRRRQGKAGERKGRKAFIYHQASAEGEAPATDLGNLVAGIVVQGVVGNRLVRRVISTAAYSRALEKGLNRPFLEPAFRKVVPVLMIALRRRFGE